MPSSVSSRHANPTPPPAGFALWQLGFRPFYLMGAAFSALSVLLWIAQLSDLLPPAFLPDSLWHPHEMLFGFTTAIIAGFLLTAVRAWTGQPTPTGQPLMALAALWLLGRILALTSFGIAAAVINIAFPLAVAFAIAIPLRHARNVRNYFFVGILVLLGMSAAVFYLALYQRLPLTPVHGIQLALDVVLFIMTVIGGRVIPMFTNNGVPGAHATRRQWLERVALALVAALFLADAIQAPPAVLATIALGAGTAHAIRLSLWQPWRTLRTPLVWILHAGYAWLVVHLVLRGLAAGGWGNAILATHALTMGAIGCMTIGMMTRTARGHTARPLKADGYEVAAYGLILLAAILRVGGGMLVPSLYLQSVQWSGLLWAAGFGIYALRYWTILTRPRLDGKPG